VKSSLSILIQLSRLCTVQ